jgi:hypothetical protein
MRFTLLALVIACHRQPTTSAIANNAPPPPDAAVDTPPPPDPRFVECDTFMTTLRRALDCKSLDAQTHARLEKLDADMGPAIVERYMDGGDGFSVNQQCVDETANIESIATVPCGW